MKSITLADVSKLIEKADIVMTYDNEGARVQVGVNECEGSIIFYWDDDSGSYEVRCNADDNEEVMKNKNVIVLNSTENTIEILLFKLTPIK